MAQNRPSRGTAGTTRIMAKLKNSLESGNFYEAHQMYRTLYFRYSGQSKFQEAEDLLYEGALELFDVKQVSSGTDLSRLFVEVLAKTENRSEQSREAAFQRLATLTGRIPVDCPDLDAFKSQALKWSSSSEYTLGHPRYHQLVAYEMWTYNRYPESRQNFLHSCDGSGCGLMLVEYHTAKGFPREVDLFIVGTVLQYLRLRKHIVAALALQSYTQSHPSIKKGPPFNYPLLNFAWLLLLAIEHKGSLAMFSVLVEKYQPSLQRNPAFLENVDKIGQNFFGLPGPQRPQGMFSGVFDSIFSALNEGEERQSGGEDQQMETQDLD